MSEEACICPVCFRGYNHGVILCRKCKCLTRPLREGDKPKRKSPPRLFGRRRIGPTRRAEVYERDDNKCVECGATERLTIDHIVPISKGGSNETENLQTMCEPCNGKKGNKVPA